MKKFPSGPIIGPRPGPTFEIEVAAPEIAVIKSSPFKDNNADNKKNIIKSHGKIEIEAKTVSNAKEILDLSTDVDVIGIDEAQFFSEDLVDVCNTLANGGTRVIVAGLDMDFSGKPFGPMPNLMAIAEEVTKVHAVCSETGEPALYSYRKGKNDNVVLLGEKDEYEPLSRKAFISKMKNK